MNDINLRKHTALTFNVFQYHLFRQMGLAHINDLKWLAMMRSALTTNMLINVIHIKPILLPGGDVRMP